MLKVAVETWEGGTLNLGSYRTHAGAEDENDEERGDAGKERVNTGPL